MHRGIIHHIAEKLKTYSEKVFLVENNDRFLYRNDVQDAFRMIGIEIVNGSSIEQRIHFEMREPDGLLIMLSQDNSNYLEDIQKQAIAIEFGLANFLSTYHITSLLDLELTILDSLFRNQPYVTLNRRKTQEYIKQMTAKIKAAEPVFDIDDFASTLAAYLDESPINWAVISRLIAEGISKTIGTDKFDQLYAQVNRANAVFQKTLEQTYHQTKNSSAVKKPRIVSKILEYLNFNYKDSKIALIVIDGMALWQYEIIKNQLTGKKHEEIIYSWLPSITQLSRQAIFRGDIPHADYRQGPVNEEKLWKEYWKQKAFQEYEIAYQHGNIDLSNIDMVSKLAVVLKDLDDKLHSSTDYVDLSGLTQNWIKRSEINQIVEQLINKGFTVFLTTDHGNIQAKGWRGLKGREKLGTHKSGSRSERHLEYSERWLYDDFMRNNPEIENLVTKEGETIYFTTDLSFSNKESLVTHGGAHLLEVLIPFVEIRNEL